MTDEQLLVRYRETGDREIFARLVKRYERELFNYLKRYLGDAEAAEDAFQAAFLQVHLKCDQFEEGRRFRPWLYTIATHQAIDWQRRNRRHQLVSLDRRSRFENQEEAGRLIDLLESEDDGPLVLAESLEVRENITHTLAGLPPLMRQVIHLVYYEGMKYREAAEVLDVPVGTIKSRLNSAISQLTDAWTGAYAE